ncbi:hypothetical protein ACFVHW_03955 [Streptomyces sp. NPDC127110]|uniref:hypothetical protein n=1 Tax=Streptomyces sp. NPDC127110 TaxID=3345362 RepID=UPI00363F1638
MDYAYAVKRLPQPDDPAAEEPVEMPPEPEPPQGDDARPWAGDLYDEGDESDPAQAFASFSGQAGEQAWLDKAEDGTLTGWVRDETGQVWRYSDPDAWAIDVDDAGMAQTGGTGTQAGATGADPAAADEQQAAGPGAPDDVPPLEFGTADDLVPDEDAPSGTADEPDDTDPVEDGTEEDEDPDEDEEDDPPGTPGRGDGE